MILCGKVDCAGLGRRFALRSFRHPTLLLFLILFVLWTGRLLLAQDKTSPEGDASAARSAQSERQLDGSSSMAETMGRSVLVDVIATDPQGRPVGDLTEEDFGITEKVDWATPIPEKLARFRATSKTAPQDRPQTLELLSSPPGNNATRSAEPEAPLTVLLLDGLNTDLHDPSVREQVASMADLVCEEHSKRPSCADVPIAVLQLGPRLEMLQDFDSDRAVLQSTLHGLLGEPPESKRPPGAQESVEAADASFLRSPVRGWDRDPRGGSVQDRRTQLTMDAIRAIARHLAGYPGRKRLIWVSSSFPFSIAPDPGTNALDDSMGYRSQAETVMNALANARLSVYPARPGLFPRNAAGGGTSHVAATPVLASGAYFAATVPMEVFAEQTGGLACIDDRDLADCFERVLSHGLQDYEIEYFPSAENRDEGFHRIEVTVPRSGVHLSYGRYYYVRRESHSGVDMELKQAACDDAMTATALKLTARLQTIPAERTQYALEVDGRLLAADALQDNRKSLHLDFAVCAFDARGRPLQHVQYAMRQGMSVEELKSLRREGIRRLLEFQPAAGTALIRWAVRDSVTGNFGSVDLLYHAPPAAVAVNSATKDGTSDGAGSGNSSNASAERTNVPQTQSSGASVNAGGEALALDADSEINSYCTAVANGAQYSTALGEFCRFTLSLPKKMPNVICDLETKRFWRAYNLAHRDVVTATVAYEDGEEHYREIKINGTAANGAALNSSWSMGEFASILEMLFSPLSDAQFKFSKEVKLNSTPAIVFEFRIEQLDNQLYYLHAFYPNGSGSTLFPTYHGKIWLNKSTFQLMRIEKETADIVEWFPISRATTLIDYADVPLGDGSHFVLPGKSEIETCERAEMRECAHNVVRFKNWHKFGAKTRILTTAEPH